MSHQFEIQPIGRFAGSSVPFKRPREIAYFSYDDTHSFRLDDSSLRYYYPPEIGSDLNKGFNTFEKLDDTADDHLDSLLRTISSLERKTGEKVDAEIITWRGMMTKIMATPFNERDGFEMRATHFDGSVFLEEDHAYKINSQLHQRRQVPRPGRPSQDAMSFWGYKFETLCLLDRPWAETSRETIENRAEKTVNNHAQYCSVVRTGIGNTVLVLGGEIDAIWDSKPETQGDPINWVELKTSFDFDPRSDRDVVNYESKLMKFWIQSFLLGVPKIIIGFRNHNGILQRVEEMSTASIPNLVKTRGRGTWNGSMCCNFTATFLDFLKQTVKGDGVWRISKKPFKSMIEVSREEECGHGDIISDEFINSRIKLKMQSTMPEVVSGLGSND